MCNIKIYFKATVIKLVLFILVCNNVRINSYTNEVELRAQKQIPK